MTIITRTSYLEVNSVPLSTPAWWITNLTPEMLAPATLKGGDIDIPHAHGGLANPRRRAITRKTFSMKITGSVNKDGTPQANQLSGLEANVDYLVANLGIASTSGDGTVTAIWHRADGTTTTAAVTVSAFETEDLIHRHITAVLELTIPAGRFT